MNPITLREMRPDDIDAAHRLSLQEGWPHRHEDWSFQLALSRGVVAICAGSVVGTGLLTPYGPDVAACNMIIVDPSARGQGLGQRLMEALLHISERRECRLVATDAGLPLYERLGFTATGKILQYQGIVSDGPAAAPTTADTETILTLDHEATGADRSSLLRRLAEEGPFIASMDGFAASRRFGHGHTAGPVVARDTAAAETLLRATIARHSGAFLRVDLSADGARFAPLLTASGLAHVGGGIAMVRAPRTGPAGNTKVFALVSQAFG